MLRDLWHLIRQDAADVWQEVLETLFKWDKREVITMSKENDGGPAFPMYVPDDNAVGPETVPGMSLRDYFAAKALQGLVAHYGNEGASTAAFHQASAAAYCLADAMIETREEE